MLAFERRTHRARKEVGQDTQSAELFYLLGLIQGDGCWSSYQTTIANSDPEIVELLSRWDFKTYDRPFHHHLCSVDLCDFMEFIGMGKGAKNKVFPERLFQGSREQIKAFVQGWFDTDGSSHARRGTVKISSICLQAMKDLQVVLLNFGIVTALRTAPPGVSDKVHGRHPCYSLEATGYFANEFYEKIGFRLPRKQRNRASLQPNTLSESGNVYPVDVSRLEGYSLAKCRITNPSSMTRRMIRQLHNERPHPYLGALLSERLFYSPVVNIEESQCEVYDFVIPETKSFFSGGLISHNTPRGKNHLWALKELAENSPEWFYYKLTVEDTNHIPLAEIEREKREGLMSEDMIMQEYYTSFEMGVEGAYYAKYVDIAKREQRVGFVPWENAFKVHTAWDIGVRDFTSIIFFQTIGQTIRLIDFYENSKEGLEHYAAVLESKPYVYGKHIAPHDIRVKEWGSGLTRLQKASELGIPFTVADDVSIMDGIEAVRSTFSKLWIDQGKCAKLLTALENYRQEFDHKKKVYKRVPLHDVHSHAADAMRYLCTSLPKTQDSLTAEALEKRWRETAYPEAAIPAPFQQPSGFY
jgi:hypothetical protein